LKKIPDVAQLDRLLARVERASELESLLRKITSVPLLDRMLTRAGTGAILQDLLKEVSDAIMLDSMLQKVRDGAELQALLKRVNDGVKLFNMLSRVRDGAQLTRLLDRIANIEQVDRLLARVANGTQLEALLRLTDDASQLERLVARIADPLQLRRLLLQASIRAGDTDLGFRLERALRKLGPGNKTLGEIEEALEAQKKIDNKILYAEKAQPTNLRIIGGHSPRILRDPRFRIISQTVNTDGTIEARLQKILAAGPPPVLSRPKESTLAPASFSDRKILEIGDAIARRPVVQTRVGDGATLHRGVVDGVEWVVIKNAAGEVTASFPTGGRPFNL